MRVIAGKARRLQLKTVEGLGTRPTTDRIKETLFNMINTDIIDCNFLDLFAGSGAIGIEALSRGAKKAWFIERDAKAVSCIKENLKTTKLQEQATVLTTEAIAGLDALERQGVVFDLIFMDPPYRMELEKAVLEKLNDSSLIHEDSMIIVEASLDTTMDYVEEMNFVIQREKMYKTNKHVFLSVAPQN